MNNFKRNLNKFINPKPKNEKEEKIDEVSRLKALSRFVETETDFLGHTIRIVDNASYFFIRKEIFELEIYKFNCDNPRPYIIDCGANVGLGIIYFKWLFPDAQVVAFEADDRVFEALKFNINSFQFSNIALINKACWNEVTTLKFYSEGADGGRVAFDTDTEKIIEVKTVRLREFLTQRVDFLKIDIEGAETKVLKDCTDLLLNVDKLFVEYHSFKNQEQTLSSLLQILKNAGFRYQVQDIGVFSRHPFLEISDYNNMDLQLNIFAYR